MAKTTGFQKWSSSSLSAWPPKVPIIVWRRLTADSRFERPRALSSTGLPEDELSDSEGSSRPARGKEVGDIAGMVAIKRGIVESKGEVGDRSGIESEMKIKKSNSNLRSWNTASLVSPKISGIFFYHNQTSTDLFNDPHLANHLCPIHGISKGSDV